MKKFLYLILFLFSVASVNSHLYCQKTERQMAYPVLDVTVGTGIMWLFQANVSIAPTKHFYIQPRFSLTPLLMYEWGGSVGFQTRFEDNKIMRLGVGYSQGEISYLFAGDSRNRNEFYRSLYIRMDLLFKLRKSIIFNPNLNITRLSGRPIFSANFTVGYVLFR